MCRLHCSQVVTVPKAVLPDGRDIRFRSDLVGGGRAPVLLVRDGRHQLAPWRIRVLHILLEAIGAQPVAGPRARAGPRTVRSGVRRPRATPVPELFVFVPAQQFRRQQHAHAHIHWITAVAVRQFSVRHSRQETFVGAAVMRWRGGQIVGTPSPENTIP